MPYTIYEDQLIERFFHIDEQGKEELCQRVNLLISGKVLESWANENPETTPVQFMLLRKLYLGQYLLQSEYSQRLK